MSGDDSRELTVYGRFSPRIHFINTRVIQRAGTLETAYPIVAIITKSIALPPYPVSGSPTTGARKYAAKNPVIACQVSGKNKT
jgi:hypothetical protein